MTPPGKLDVHAHYLPEPYRQALERAGHRQPDGMPQIPAWSAGAHVALMDRLGIAAALPAVLRENTARLFPRLGADAR